MGVFMTIDRQFFPSFSFWDSKWKAIGHGGIKFSTTTLTQYWYYRSCLFCSFFLFSRALFFDLVVFFFVLYHPGAGPRLSGWTAVGATTITFFFVFGGTFVSLFASRMGCGDNCKYGYFCSGVLGPGMGGEWALIAVATLWFVLARGFSFTQASW